MVWTADHVQQIEAAPEDVGLSSAGMARLQRHVQAYVDAGKFPGAISMVQRRGKVVHFQTYGRRDVEAGTTTAVDYQMYREPESPEWSVDSRWLLTLKFGPTSDRASIEAVPVDGGSPVTISGEPADLLSPAWISG